MKNMKKEQCLVILQINCGKVKFGETTFEAIKRVIYEKISVTLNDEKLLEHLIIMDQWFIDLNHFF